LVGPIPLRRAAPPALAGPIGNAAPGSRRPGRHGVSEYGDPISPEQIELAVDKVLELRRTAPGLSLDDQVRTATAQTICGCVLGIEDDLEGHLSGTHAGVVEEVRRRVELRLADAASAARDNE